jgi:hypothetical protein
MNAGDIILEAKWYLLFAAQESTPVFSKGDNYGKQRTRQE